MRAAAAAGWSRQASRAGSPSPARSPASGTCWRSPSTSCTARRSRALRRKPADARLGGRRSRLVFVGVPVVSALFVAAVLAEKLGASEAVNLLLPVVAVCVLTAWRGLRGEGSFKSLGAPAALFLAGVMLPLVLLAVPYLATASVGDLYTGLFVTPRGRLESGYYGTAGPVALAFGVVALVVLHALGRSGRGARTTDLVASAAVAALLLVSTATLAGYLTMWYVTTALLPVGVLVGVVACCERTMPTPKPGRQPLFLLLALTAFVGARPVSVRRARLLLLRRAARGARLARHVPAHVACTRRRTASSRRAARGDRRLRVRRQPQRPLPGRDPSERQPAERRPRPRSRLDPRQPDAPSRLPRGRWRCFAPTPAVSYVYAGPDTPEIYALTGLRNPTRSLFDYLDPTGSARGENLLRTLRAPRRDGDRRSTRDPAFSDPLAPRTRGRAPRPLPVPPANRRLRGPLEDVTSMQQACSRPPRGSPRRDSRAGRRRRPAESVRRSALRRLSGIGAS